jgi:peptide/nickel transport system substrate-binding protein
MMAAVLRASTVRGVIMVNTAPLLACGPPDRPVTTVVYASGADLESANALVTVHPLAKQVQRYALFVTLARFDSLLTAAPYYARRWSWSAGHRELTFALEPSLRWHDGRPTTSRDVIFTLEAARDPRTGYPRYADLSGINHVRAPDDSTVVIAFDPPPPDFPAVLCELPILPEHLLGSIPHAEMRRAAFNYAPVGNGPFRFAQRDAGQRWVFERVPDFPASLGGPASIERLVVAVVDEPTTKFAGLVSGELDVAGISPTMASLVERNHALRVLSYPVLQSTAIIFNVHRPPFGDLRVRRAVSASLDRQRIVDAALAGFGTPASGPVPPDNPFALEEAPASSSQLADSLLDAAGWPRGADGWRARDGQRLRFSLLTVGSGDNAIEQLVQADLRARGVDMTIQQREMGSFLANARAAEKRFDALITGIPGDVTLSHLAAMYDGRLAGGALDYSSYHTSTLDSAFARTRSARSREELRAAWLDVQRLLARDLPAAWVYHPRGVQGIARRLQGVTMDLRGEMVTLSRWSLAGRPVALGR